MDYCAPCRRHLNGALKSFRYGNGIQHTTEQNMRGLPSRSSDTSNSFNITANSNLIFRTGMEGCPQ